MFEGNEDDNVDFRSLLELLCVEFGTEVGPCNIMSDRRYV